MKMKDGKQVKSLWMRMKRKRVTAARVLGRKEKEGFHKYQKNHVIR